MSSLSSNSITRIYADEWGLKYRELTERLIAIFFNIYNELGHRFLEFVYEQAFAVVLAENNILFERQIATPIWFHRIQIGEFRADLLVEKKVLIALKTGRDIDSAWEKQLLNYLRATEVEVGLRFNFGTTPLFRRYAFENDRKNPRNPRESADKRLPGSRR